MHNTPILPSCHQLPVSRFTIRFYYHIQSPSWPRTLIICKTVSHPMFCHTNFVHQSRGFYRSHPAHPQNQELPIQTISPLWTPPSGVTYLRWSGELLCFCHPTNHVKHCCSGKHFYKGNRAIV